MKLELKIPKKGCCCSKWCTRFIGRLFDVIFFENFPLFKKLTYKLGEQIIFLTILRCRQIGKRDLVKNSQKPLHSARKCNSTYSFLYFFLSASTKTKKLYLYLPCLMTFEIKRWFTVPCIVISKFIFIHDENVSKTQHNALPLPCHRHN